MTMSSFFGKKGSAKSGNWGHAGRPGKRGGSAPKKKAGLQPATEWAVSGGWFGTGEKNNKKILEDYEEIQPDVSFDEGWLEPGMEDDYAARAMAVESIAKTTGLDERDIDQNLAQWYMTSGDNDMRSLALHEDVAKEFGLNVSSHIKQKIDNAPTIGARSERILPPAQSRQMLRGMYENTQAKLRAKGIKPDDDVKLYRGFRDSHGKYDLTRVRERDAGIYIKDNVISSWSLSESVAERFADSGGPGRPGLLLVGNVKARNILSYGTTGFGSLEEMEVVVIGAQSGVARVQSINE